MACTQPVVILPSPPTNLLPSPLRIRKTARRASRRATVYRRILRKSPPQPSHEKVCGPLDDIITQISSAIWASPCEWDFRSTLHGLAKPLEDLLDEHRINKAAPTCTVNTVTLLPVSRTPSNHPLTIRKNRSSRSTASESSATHSLMALSRSSSGKGSIGSSKVCANLDTPSPPLSQADTLSQHEPASSSNTVCPAYSPAQQALEEVKQTGESGMAKRRSSLDQLFPDGFTGLLRSSSDPRTTNPSTSDEETGNGGYDSIQVPETEVVE